MSSVNLYNLTVQGRNTLSDNPDNNVEVRIDYYNISNPSFSDAGLANAIKAYFATLASVDSTSAYISRRVDTAL